MAVLTMHSVVGKPMDSVPPRSIPRLGQYLENAALRLMAIERRTMESI